MVVNNRTAMGHANEQRISYTVAALQLIVMIARKHKLAFWTMGRNPEILGVSKILKLFLRLRFAARV
jgi:hypothetical protein